MDRRVFIKSLLSSSLSLAFPIFTSASQSSFSFSDLEKLIHREYKETETLAKRDNSYLINNLGEKAKKALINHEETIERLFNYLKSLKHLNYENERERKFSKEEILYNGNSDVYRLNMRQLARVYLISESLKKEKFRNEIGREIILDLSDLQINDGFLPTERGGLVKYTVDIVSLFPVESLESKEKFSKDKAIGSNRRYMIDQKSIQDNPHILRYHLHAVEQDSTKFSGPSFDVAMGNGSIIGDLNAARERIKKVGESHNLVFTKIYGSSFNVCYYGGERMSNDKSPIIVLSLGNWHYQ